MKLKVTGYGGCGSNLVMGVVDVPHRHIGFPETEYGVVDTSESNFTDAGRDKVSQVYSIAGLDGSGRDRAYGYKNINSHIDKILLEQPPADFNIMIFSLSGGSGNILGTLIARELLERDIPVICLCVGSTGNSVEASNTLKSIRTLQNMSVAITKRPLVCKFYMNDNVTPRSVVDNAIYNDVNALAMLLSGQNMELDSTDLTNWLRYDKLTDVPSGLVDLVIHTDGADDRTTLEAYPAISVASLLPDRQSPILELNQPYGTVGYMPDGALAAAGGTIPDMHFIITNGILGSRLELLKDTVTAFETAERALSEAAITETDMSDETGMCF